MSGSASHDGLGRLVGAAAGEDGERAEEPLLRRREQVVRPLDRRAQRLLARIGVPAALEQVEPLREPLEELLGREDDRAGSRQLERERQVVEPAQSSAIGSRLEVGSTARARARKSSTPSSSASGGTG